MPAEEVWETSDRLIIPNFVKLPSLLKYLKSNVFV